jgi:hypothetical protein
MMFFPLCSISELGWSKRSYRVDFRVRVRYRAKSRYFLQFRGRFISSYDLLAHIGFLLIETDSVANYFMEFPEGYIWTIYQGSFPSFHVFLYSKFYCYILQVNWVIMSVSAFQSPIDFRMTLVTYCYIFCLGLLYVCSVIFGTSLLSSLHIFNLTRF